MSRPETPRGPVRVVSREYYTYVLQRFTELQHDAKMILDRIFVHLDAVAYHRVRKELLIAYDLAIAEQPANTCCEVNWFRLRYAMEALFNLISEPGPWQAKIVESGEAKCRICEYLTPATREAMLEHVKLVHITNNFTTTVCTKRNCNMFGTRLTLVAYRWHRALRHQSNESDEGPDHRPAFPRNVCFDFRCDDYKKVFESEDLRIKHYQDVHIPRLWAVDC